MGAMPCSLRQSQRCWAGLAGMVQDENPLEEGDQVSWSPFSVAHCLVFDAGLHHGITFLLGPFR
jgi:hypothetical protein